VALIDSLDVWDAAAWGPFGVGGPAPPNPFPNGNVKYQYLKRNAETDLQDLGEQNTGHPNTLRDFMAWALAKYPASRYILDLADHGEGWKQLCEDWRQGDDWLTMPELRSALTAQTRKAMKLTGRNCGSTICHSSLQPFAPSTRAADLAASYQAAIVDSLVARARRTS